MASPIKVSLKHLAKLEDAGISASQACELDDKQLEAFLYPMSPGPKSNEKVMPDLDAIIAGLATAHSHRKRGADLAHPRVAKSAQTLDEYAD